MEYFLLKHKMHLLHELNELHELHELHELNELNELLWEEMDDMLLRHILLPSVGLQQEEKYFLKIILIYCKNNL